MTDLQASLVCTRSKPALSNSLAIIYLTSSLESSSNAPSCKGRDCVSQAISSVRQLANSASPLETISKGKSHDSGPRPSAQALPTIIDLETQNDLTAQGMRCSPREAPSTVWIQRKEDYLKSAMEPTPRNTKEI